MTRVRKNKKNTSRKLKQVQPQKGGGIGTTAQIRNALWKLRDHWNDLNAIKQDLPDYSTLIDNSRYNSDWGLPSFKALNDQRDIFNANYRIVNNTTLENNISLPTQTNAINALKSQLTTLYNDCTAKVAIISTSISSITNTYNTYSSLWLQTNLWYPIYYTASVALIPDTTYNQWKSTSSSSTPYPTDTPSDSEINNAILSNGSSLTLQADNYLLDVVNGRGAASFSLIRANAYKSYLDAVNASPVTSALNTIDANLKKVIDIVAQSKVVVFQVEIELYKWKKALMGVVTFPEYNNKTVLFMSAPFYHFTYMDLDTYMIYLTDYNTIKNSQVMTDLVKGCLEFRDKLAVVGTTAAVITALPNNSLVKALLLKDTITAKIASIKVTDITG